MNIQTQKNPDGRFQALDADNDPSAEHASDTPEQPIGHGDTAQAAADDLCRNVLGLNYSIKVA